MIADWPPPYTIRTSKRAKQVSLKITPSHGLELIIPSRARSPDIPALLEEHKTWILRSFRNLSAQITAYENIEAPTELNIPALKFHWPIEYTATDSDKTYIKYARQTRTISIKGDIKNIKKIRSKLLTWLSPFAFNYFNEQLTNLSQQTNLNYNKLTVRAQKTRWGSCTTTGTISLNIKLLWLPENLIQHILLHELCHTIHPNHSTAFWKLLKTVDPYSESHQNHLKSSQQYLPLWLEL